MKKLLLLSLLTLSSSLFNLCNAQYTDLLEFSGSGSTQPNGNGSRSNLTFSGNKFYGMTSAGGTSGDGNIFCVDTDGNNYKDLLDFTGPNGNIPYGSLTLVRNKLYGTTPYGGTHNAGNVFSIDTDGNAYSDMYDFMSFPNPNYPYGTLTLVNNKLYGMTENGGANDSGTIFSIDTNGGYQDVLDFNGNAYPQGMTPKGELSLIGNKLYGTTAYGGLNNTGVIFSLDTNGSGYDTLYNFGKGLTDGNVPNGYLTLIGNKFYGMTVLGGVHNIGVIFSIDTNGGSNSYKHLIDLSVSNGGYPAGGLTASSTDILYGTTGYAAGHGVGGFFSIDTNGNNFTNIIDFNVTGYPEGSFAQGNVTISGNNLYGITQGNGSTDFGNVFRYTTLNSLATTDSGATCHGYDNGHATAYINGGTQPYTYAWSNGTTTVSTSNTTGHLLSMGTYTVTITDSVGSSATTSVNIGQPTAVSFSANTTANNVCYGGTIGSAGTITSGGTGSYTYSWTGGAGSADSVIALNTGNYTVTVNDSNGCSKTAAISISSPTAISVISDSVSDNGTGTGLAAVTVSGGTAPYTYMWAAPGNQTTDTITGLSAGTYTCTIRDKHDCDDIVSITVKSVPAGIVNISAASGQVTIYPNPNNGQFIVGFSHPELVSGSQTTIEVYNMLGEQVLAETLRSVQGYNTISMNNQPDGIYLYRIITSTGNLLGEGKLIIQK